MDFFKNIFEHKAPNRGDNIDEAAGAKTQASAGETINIPVIDKNDPIVIEQVVAPKKETGLNDHGEKALSELRSSLETQGLTENERPFYIDKFIAEIDGELDPNKIDNAFNNIAWDAKKKAEALKVQGGATVDKSAEDIASSDASKVEDKKTDEILLENGLYKRNRNEFCEAFDAAILNPLFTGIHEESDINSIKKEFSRVVRVLQKENKLVVQSAEKNDVWNAIAKRVLSEVELEGSALEALNALFLNVLADQNVNVVAIELPVEVIEDTVVAQAQVDTPEVPVEESPEEAVSSAAAEEVIAPIVEISAEEKRKENILKKKINYTNNTIDNAEKVRVKKAQSGESVDEILIKHIGIPDNLPEEENKKIVARIDSANIKIREAKNKHKTAQRELRRKNEQEQEKENDVWIKELKKAIEKLKKMTMTMEDADAKYDHSQYVDVRDGDFSKELSDFLHAHEHDSVDKFTDKEKERFENAVESAKKINDQNNPIEVVIINGHTYKFKKEMQVVAVDNAEVKKNEAERLQQEQLAAQQADIEFEAIEKAEQEKIAAQQVETERLRLEAEKQENIRQEQEKIEIKRIEAERIESERKEQERLERERIVAEQAATQQAERELEALEKAEQERLEKEKLEKEEARKEAERIEAENREVVAGLSEKNVEIFRKNAAIFVENLKKNRQDAETESGVAERSTQEERVIKDRIATKIFLRNLIAEKEAVMKDKMRFVSEKSEELVEFVCKSIFK
jgi:hypothetical protein